MAQVYIVAGEPSGDMLGGRLIAALRALNPAIRVCGVGGEQMAAQGFASLFPMQELSVMGFLEVLPHIRRLRRRLEETAQDILNRRPDAVVTIDSPGFTFRLARRLQGSGIPLVHYVAPTVWAYKPERASRTAALFDRLLTLLPFEPPYFEAHGLNCRFVGHPIVEGWRERPDAGAFRDRHELGARPLVCLLPGSRMGELTRHLPVFRDALSRVVAAKPGVAAVIPALAHTRAFVEAQTARWPVPVIVVSEGVERRAALAAGDAALAKSGTVSLELALAGTPMVTTYRVNPVSAWLLRRMLKSPYVNLVNILTGREAVPERLQELCTPEALSAALLEVLTPEQAAAQRAAFAEALSAIGNGWDVPPSACAAEAVMEAAPALRG